MREYHLFILLFSTKTPDLGVSFFCFSVFLFIYLFLFSTYTLCYKSCSNATSSGCLPYGGVSISRLFTFHSKFQTLTLLRNKLKLKKKKKKWKFSPATPSSLTDKPSFLQLASKFSEIWGPNDASVIIRRTQSWRTWWSTWILWRTTGK